MESGPHEPGDHLKMHRATSGHIGHFGPGCVFIIFGCLWTYNALFRYHVARRQAILRGNDSKKLNYKNSLFSIYHSGWARAAPVEAIVVFLFVIGIFIGEIISYHMGESAIMALHHFLLYFFFGVMAAVSILQYYRFTVPPSSEYVAFILTNAATAFLMANHLSGRKLVDGKMHMIVVYMNVVQIVCVAIEVIYNRSVTAALGRTLMYVIQGIWACVMGAVIFPLPFMPVYDLNDHGVLDVVSSLAVVAVAIAMMVAFAMNVIVARRVSNMDLATVNYIVSVTQPRRSTSGTKGDAANILISDSDCGI